MVYSLFQTTHLFASIWNAYSFFCPTLNIIGTTLCNTHYLECSLISLDTKVCSSTRVVIWCPTCRHFRSSFTTLQAYRITYFTQICHNFPLFMANILQYIAMIHTFTLHMQCYSSLPYPLGHSLHQSHPKHRFLFKTLILLHPHVG